jgi:hypothetical protein
MTVAMPPASNADALEKRSVALPPSLWKGCEKIADDNGEKLSEVYRRIFTQGLAAEKARVAVELEYSNKLFINERLAAKKQAALDAVAQLESIAADMELMNEVMPSDVAGIAEKFKAWLSR